MFIPSKMAKLTVRGIWWRAKGKLSFSSSLCTRKLVRLPFSLVIVISGFRKALRLPITAKQTASVTFPSANNIITSQFTLHTFCPATMHKLSVSIASVSLIERSRSLINSISLSLSLISLPVTYSEVWLSASYCN